jgi:hypothetical protein
MGCRGAIAVGQAAILSFWSLVECDAVSWHIGILDRLGKTLIGLRARHRF